MPSTHKLESDILLTTLYTFEASGVIRRIDLKNSTSSAVTVRLYLVDDGDAEDAAHGLTPGDVSIPANQTVSYEGPENVSAGMRLRSIASAVGVGINVVMA